MADKPDSNTKIVHLNPAEDNAIVLSCYSDDGLFDGELYEEWRQMQETGDRTERDYADYEVQTSECD